MADIEMVIKIPERLTCEGFERLFTEEEKNILIKAIGNGTPLPKGHGDLIDRGKLSICPIDITDLPQDKCLMVYLADDVNNAEIIIEADKESD